MKIRTGVYIELEPGDLVARQGCVTYISTPKRLKGNGGCTCTGAYVTKQNDPDLTGPVEVWPETMEIPDSVEWEEVRTLGAKETEK